MLTGSTTIANSSGNIITDNSFYIPLDTQKHLRHKSQFNSYVERFHKIDCIDYKELRSLLKSTPMTKELSYNLTFGMENDLDIVYALHKFVYHSIKYEPTHGTLTPDRKLT